MNSRQRHRQRYNDSSTGTQDDNHLFAKQPFAFPPPVMNFHTGFLAAEQFNQTYNNNCARSRSRSKTRSKSRGRSSSNNNNKSSRSLDPQDVRVSASTHRRNLLDSSSSNNDSNTMNSTMNSTMNDTNAHKKTSQPVTAVHYSPYFSDPYGDEDVNNDNVDEGESKQHQEHSIGYACDSVFSLEPASTLAASLPLQGFSDHRRSHHHRSHRSKSRSRGTSKSRTHSKSRGRVDHAGERDGDAVTAVLDRDEETYFMGEGCDVDTKQTLEGYANRSMDWGRRFGECMVLGTDTYKNQCLQQEDPTRPKQDISRHYCDPDLDDEETKQSSLPKTIYKVNKNYTGNADAETDADADNNSVLSRHRQQRQQQETRTNSNYASTVTTTTFNVPQEPSSLSKLKEQTQTPMSSKLLEAHTRSRSQLEAASATWLSDCATMNEVSACVPNDDIGGQGRGVEYDVLRDHRLQTLFQCNDDTTNQPEDPMRRALLALATQDKDIQQLQAKMDQSRLELAALNAKHAGTDASENIHSVEIAGATLTSMGVIALRAELELLKSQLMDTKAELVASRGKGLSINNGSQGSADTDELEKLQQKLKQTQETIRVLKEADAPSRSDIPSKGYKDSSVLLEKLDAAEVQVAGAVRRANELEKANSDLMKKLEAAECQASDTAKEADELTQTNSDLSRALAAAKEDNIKMRNDVFNAKMKLAKAESRADSLQHANRNFDHKTLVRVNSWSSTSDSHPEDETRSQACAIDAEPKMVLPRLLELEKANQEILNLRLELAKAKSSNKDSSCCHGDELEELECLRFSCSELKQEIQHYKARENLAKELCESETKWNKVTESELEKKCKDVQAEVAEVASIKSELEEARDQLAKADSQALELDTFVQEMDNKLLESKREKEGLAAHRDALLSELQELRVNTAFRHEMFQMLADHNMRQHAAANEHLARAAKESRELRDLVVASKNSTLCFQLITAVSLVASNKRKLALSGERERCTKTTEQLKQEMRQKEIEFSNMFKNSAKEKLDVSNELDHAKREKQEMEKTITLLNDKLSRLQLENTANSDKETNRQEEVSKAEALNDELQEKLDIVTDELNEAHNATELAQQQMKAREDELTHELAKQKQLLFDEKEALKEEVSKAEAHIVELRDKLGIVNEELKEAHNATELAQQQMKAKADGLVAELSKQKQLLLDEKKAKQEEVSKAEAHSVELQEKLDVVTDELKEAHNATELAQQEMKSKEDDLVAEFSRQKQLLFDEKEAKQKEVSKAEAQIVELQGKLDIVIDKLKEANNATKLAQHQMKTREEELINEIAKQGQLLCDETRTKKLEVSKAEAHIAELQDKLDIMTEELKEAHNATEIAHKSAKAREYELATEFSREQQLLFDENEAKQEEASKAEAHIVELQDKLNIVNEELKDAINATELAQQQMKAKEDELVTDLAKLNKLLFDEKEAKQEEVSKAQAHIVVLQDTLNIVTEELNHVQSAFELAQQQMTAREDELTTELSKQKQLLLDEKEENHKKVSKAEAHISELQDELGLVTEKLNDAHNATELAQHQMQAREEEFVTKLAKLNQLLSDKETNRQEDVSKAEALNDDLQEKLDIFTEQLKEAHQTSELAQQEMIAKEDGLVTELTKQKQLLFDEKNAMQEEASKAEAHIVELQNKLKRVTENLKEAHNATEITHKSAKAREYELVTEFSRQKKLLFDEKETKQKEVSKAEAQIVELQGKLDIAMEGLKEANNPAELAQQQMKTREEELINQLAKLNQLLFDEREVKEEEVSKAEALVVELRGKLGILTEKLKEAHDATDIAQQQMKAKEDELVAELSKQKQVLFVEKEARQEDVSKAQSHILVLQDTLDIVTGKLKEAHNATELAQQQMKAREDELETELSKQKQLLLDEKEAKQEEASKAEAHIVELQDKLDIVNEELKEVHNATELAQQQMKAKEDKLVAELSKQKQLLLDEKKAKQEEVSKAEACIVELQGKMDIVMEELKEAHNATDIAQQQMKAREEEFIAELAKLNQLLSDKETNRQEEVSKAEALNDELQEKLDIFTEQLKEAHQATELAQQEMIAKEDELVTELTKQKQLLFDEKNAMQEEASKAEAHIVELQNKLNRVTENLKEAHNATELAQQQMKAREDGLVAELSKQKQLLLDEKKAKQEEVSKAEAHSVELQEKLDIVTDELKEANNATELAQQQMKAREDALGAEMRLQKQSLVAEMDAKCEELSTALSSNTELQKKFIIVSEQLKEAQLSSQLASESLQGNLKAAKQRENDLNAELSTQKLLLSAKIQEVSKAESCNASLQQKLDLVTSQLSQARKLASQAEDDYEKELIALRATNSILEAELLEEQQNLDRETEDQVRVLEISKAAQEELQLLRKQLKDIQDAANISQKEANSKLAALEISEEKKRDEMEQEHRGQSREMEAKIIQLTEYAEMKTTKLNEQLESLSANLKEVQSEATRNLQEAEKKLSKSRVREAELAAEFATFKDAEEMRSLEMHKEIHRVQREAEETLAQSKEEICLLLVRIKELDDAAHANQEKYKEEMEKCRTKEAALEAELTKLKETGMKGSGVDERALREELEEILSLLQGTKERWHEDTKRIEEERRISKAVEARLVAEINELREAKTPKLGSSAQRATSASEPDNANRDSLHRNTIPTRSNQTTPQHKNSETDIILFEDTFSGSRPDDEPPFPNLSFRTPKQDNRSAHQQKQPMDPQTKLWLDYHIGNVGKLQHVDTNPSLSTIDRAISDVTASEADTGIPYDLRRLAQGYLSSSSHRINSVNSTPPALATEESSIASESSVLSPPALSATAAVLSGLPEPTPIRPAPVSARNRSSSAGTASSSRSVSSAASKSSRPLELASKLRAIFDHQTLLVDDEEDEDEEEPSAESSEESESEETFGPALPNQLL